MTDVLVQTIEPNRYRLHIGSTDGFHWLSDHTSTQEWNRGLYFDVNRVSELLSDMHVEGITVEDLERVA